MAGRREDDWLQLRKVMRGSSVEANLKLLGIAGLGLFLTLVAASFLVQRGLIVAQARLSESALPVLSALDQVDAAIGAALRRSAQLASAQRAAEVDALRDRSALEARLGKARETLKTGFATVEGGTSAESTRALAALKDALDAFIAADAALLEAVAAGQAASARVDGQLAAVDGELRSLVGGARAIAGALRLEYIVTLRQIALAMDDGGQPPAGLVRRITLGTQRANLDDANELVDAALSLSALTSKAFLAPTTDALDALSTHELAPLRARVDELLAALHGRLEKSAQLAPLDALGKRANALLPRLFDAQRPDSLVALRRSALVESARTDALRSQAVERAHTLDGLIETLRREARTHADRAVDDARSAVVRGRAISALVWLLGALVCALAALRIRNSLAALRKSEQARSELAQKLDHVNQNLETIVAERTDALTQRERALQLVLDSMDEGVLSVGLDGTLRPERARSVVRWFGPPPRGISIWSYLFPDDPAGASQFRLGFEQLVAEVLPFELSADQMLNRIVRSGRTYDLDFQAAREGGQLVGIVVTVRDVSLVLEAERAERHAHEEQHIIAHLLRDKRSFGQMVRECEGLLAQIVDADDLSQRRRALHTLKNQCAIHGFISVAELAHELEHELDEGGGLKSDAAQHLVRRWRETMQRIDAFTQRARDDGQYVEGDFVLSSLKRRVDYADLARLVDTFRLDPASTPLRRLATQAFRIAQDLDKPIHVQVVDNGVRLPADRFRGLFANLALAVRNALEHGIEPAEQRVSAGKPAEGTISLRATALAADMVAFEVEDDGAGIDFDAVARVARARGLPADSPDALTAALFADGFSTRTASVSPSGRGVGLGALRVACETLSGMIAIESVPGRGTIVRCTVPMRDASSAARASIKPSAPRASVAPTRRMSVHTRSLFPESSH